MSLLTGALSLAAGLLSTFLVNVAYFHRAPASSSLVPPSQAAVYRFAYAPTPVTWRQEVVQQRRAKPAPRRSKPREAGDSDRDDPHYRRDHRPSCLSPVRGLGTQWVDENGGRDAAIKDWRERVRYDSGENYSDWKFAQGKLESCNRTSIGNVAGQYFWRCEVWATPCRPELKEGQ